MIVLSSFFPWWRFMELLCFQKFSKYHLLFGIFRGIWFFRLYFICFGSFWRRAKTLLTRACALNGHFAMIILTSFCPWCELTELPCFQKCSKHHLLFDIFQIVWFFRCLTDFGCTQKFFRRAQAVPCPFALEIDTLTRSMSSSSLICCRIGKLKNATESSHFFLESKHH